MRNNILKLFRYASIAMSLLSCFTTYQGFHNTVFASEPEPIAALASIAIQTVLLAGVLKYFPTMIEIIKECIYEVKKRKNDKKGTGFVIFKNIFKGVIITIIIMIALAISVIFSYISISNNMYENDFAVNANIKLEDFMRTSVNQMQSDEEEYINALRSKIVEELNENGKEIIQKSIEQRAKNYVNSTTSLTKIPGKKNLITLYTEGKKKFESDREKIKLNDKRNKVNIILVTRKYVEKQYNYITPNNPRAFQNGIKTKINNFNYSLYSLYCQYYNKYYDLVEQYNQWYQNIKDTDLIPSLTEIRSFHSTCNSLGNNIQKMLESINNTDTESAPKTTQRLIVEAAGNTQPLYEAVLALKEDAINLQENIYRDDMPYEEIVSAFGSASTKLNQLKKARDQMLQMQGVLMSDSNEDVSSIANLMENLEKYVYTVQYSKEIKKMKKQIDKKYNIDNSIIRKNSQEKETKEEADNTIEEINKNAVSEFQTKITTEASIEINTITIPSIYVDLKKSSGASISLKLLDTDETGNNMESESTTKNKNNSKGIITISTKKWTKIKKNHMTRFTALIYDHPVYLYCSNAAKNKIRDYINSGKTAKEADDTYKSYYDNLKDKAYKYRKYYLDTSDAEKAKDLLFEKDEYFEYKDKAKLSIIIACFLDIGAFAIGFLIFCLEKRSINIRKKGKGTIFRSRIFKDKI